MSYTIFYWNFNRNKFETLKSLHVPEISICYKKMHRCLDDRRESRWRHTSVCDRSWRVEESSKACSNPSARAIFTHHGHAFTYCLAHKDAIRVTARASRLSMFSQRGSEGKKSSSIFPLNFQYVAVYTPFNNLR